MSDRVFRHLMTGYIWALVAGFTAMSAHVALVFYKEVLVQQLNAAVGTGLIFGHSVAFVVLLTRDIPRTLSHWPRSIQVGLSATCGLASGMLSWWLHTALFLQVTAPDWPVLLSGGVGLAFGFSAALVIRPRRIISIVILMIVTTCAIYIPIYVTFQNYLNTYLGDNPARALLYFQPDNPEHVWLIGLPFACCIAFFGQLPLLFSIQHDGDQTCN